MNPIIEELQRAQGTAVFDEEGEASRISLLPPLSPPEIKRLQQRIPCPIPTAMLEVFQFCRGFEGSALDTVDFSGKPYRFGFEQFVPHAVELAADGFGNHWIADLVEDATVWGPILYVCHDAPVLVYQCESLLHFIEEVLRFGQPPFAREINDVHEQHSDRIWRENPGLRTPAECAQSADPMLREFAAQLDESWLVCDLRDAKTGDGFSWGRYGPKTQVRRFGSTRIFAYQKRSWGRRVLDALF